MLDKLFVRVRSWLHNDPTGVLGDPALSKPGSRKKQTLVTPPPLPPDAWNESESGMVITESGIIIIDPAALEANRPSPPARPGSKISEDNAWALPNLPRPGAPHPVSASVTSPSPAPMSAAATTTGSHRTDDAEALNWDEVLARAKARISAVPDPGPTSPSKQRAK